MFFVSVSLNLRSCKKGRASGVVNADIFFSRFLSSHMNNEQAILDFCAVTGASTDVAEDYLQVCLHEWTVIALYIQAAGSDTIRND